MKEFNFIIDGGGCSGLSLAYEMEKKGILDKTHTRLFTFSTFKNLIEQSDYLIKTENLNLIRLYLSKNKDVDNKDTLIKYYLSNYSLNVVKRVIR